MLIAAVAFLSTLACCRGAMPWGFQTPGLNETVPRFKHLTLDGSYENASELAIYVQNYSVVVLNNGVGPLRTSCHHANAYQHELCRRVKAAPGGANIPCLSYLQGQFALGYIDSTNSSFLNQTNTSHMWLKDPSTGKPFSSRFQYPPSCPGFDRFWDFRQADTRRLLLDIVAQFAADPNVDGIFFDDFDISYCGGDCPNCGGMSCDCQGEAEASSGAADAMWDAGVLLWAEVGQLLNKAGKLPIYSSVNKFSTNSWPFIAGGRYCHRPEDDFVSAMKAKGVMYARYYEMYASEPGLSGDVVPSHCAKDIQNLHTEAHADVPVFVRAELGPPHSSGNERCQNTTESAEFAFAKFLVAAAGENHFLTVFCGGFGDPSTRWFEQYRTQLGNPTSEMEILPGFGFRREFEKFEVLVNCSTQEGRIVPRS